MATKSKSRTRPASQKLPQPIIGLYFHASARDARGARHGRVLAYATDETLLVQLCDWPHERATRMTMVDVATMVAGDWSFYADAPTWRAADPDRTDAA